MQITKMTTMIFRNWKTFVKECKYEWILNVCYEGGFLDHKHQFMTWIVINYVFYFPRILEYESINHKKYVIMKYNWSLNYIHAHFKIQWYFEIPLNTTETQNLNMKLSNFSGNI